MIEKILTIFACTMTGAILLMCCEYAVIFARPELFGRPIPLLTPGLYVMGHFGEQGGHMPNIALMLNVDFIFDSALVLLLILRWKRRSKKRKESQ
jgi:hypothetical protein